MTFGTLVGIIFWLFILSVIVKILSRIVRAVQSVSHEARMMDHIQNQALEEAREKEHQLEFQQQYLGTLDRIAKSGQGDMQRAPEQEYSEPLDEQFGIEETELPTLSAISETSEVFAEATDEREQPLNIYTTTSTVKKDKKGCIDFTKSNLKKDKKGCVDFLKK